MLQGYNLVRTHDGTGAFVIVDHDEEDAIQANAPISNIYSAGFNTSLYTLSLRRNYRRGFVTDFARIEGLPGGMPIYTRILVTLDDHVTTIAQIRW